MEKTVPILPALNINKTILFYRDTLQFNILNYGNYLVVFNKNAELHFYECNDPALCRRSGCYILVKNIEDYYAGMSGLDIISPEGKLETKPWKIKEFSIRDNNGNLIRFGEKQG